MEVMGSKDNVITVMVPLGAVHGYKNIYDEDGVLLNYPNKLYQGWVGRSG